MNSQAKFLISTLFIVIIILCVILTRFYLDVTKNTENTHDNKMDSIVRNFGDMQVFRSVNGCYGLMNQEHSVIIEPEWLDILDVTDNIVLVSGKMEHEVLIGGVDYEENIILPFVFASMEKLGDGYHLGTVRQDNRCIVYDKDYLPVFSESFEKVTYHNKLMQLYATDGCYCYFMAGTEPQLLSAELQCQLDETLYLDWRIANQVYLSELQAQDLKEINHHVSAYMQMLLKQDFTGIEEISGKEYAENVIRQPLLSDVTWQHVSKFSFFRRESGAYDFHFLLDYSGTEHQEELTGQAEMHFYFRKNAENRMVLTAVDLQSRNADGNF